MVELDKNFHYKEENKKEGSKILRKGKRKVINKTKISEKVALDSLFF